LAPPKPGEVINYSYLWEQEYREGRDEGAKDRPVAVVLVTQSADGIDQIHVVPMTTKPPTGDQKAVEVPEAVRRRLELFCREIVDCRYRMEPFFLAGL